MIRLAREASTVTAANAAPIRAPVDDRTPEPAHRVDHGPAEAAALAEATLEW